MFQRKTAASPDKNSPQYQLQQYQSSRGTLLAAVVFTLVNLVLYWVNLDLYFLFSISVPYYGAVLGDLLGIKAIATAVGLIVLAVYLLCWYLSKQRWGFLTLATVLFVADFVILLLLMVFLELYANVITDIIFHALILFYLIRGVRCAGKLRKSETEGFARGPELDSPAEPRGPEF